MDVLTQAVELLAGYSVRWRTRGGYIRVLIVALAAVAVAARSLDIGKITTIYAVATVVIVWTGLWFVGSGRVAIPRERLTIVFAFDVEVEAERNFYRIFVRLQSELQSLSLLKPIAIRRIASDLIRDDAAASRYCRNFAIDQVVWGRALSGKSGNRQIDKFDVFWTQRLPDTVNIEAIRADVQLLIAGRQWRVRDEDDIEDVAVVAEDFIEVGLGAIGIRLFLEGQLVDAVVVLERVVKGLATHAGANPSEQRKEQIVRYLRLLNATRQNLAIEAHKRGDNRLTVQLLEAVLATGEPTPEALMTVARAHYYLNNLDAAIRYTEQIRLVDNDHPSISVNLAFFNIVRRDYRAVCNYYDQLLNSARDSLPILPSVSEFLEERYAEQPHEHAFLYGLAIINGLTDAQVLRDDLKAFLEKSDGVEAYAALRERARQLLAER